MFKNYITVAFRNFKRNYVFTAINILGLTLGLAIGLIILLYLVNELTYDTYQKDSKNIYRLFTSIQLGERARMTDPKVNAPLGPYLLENYEDIITQTRISDEETFRFKINNNEFKETLYYADTSFFQIFTLKFLYGTEKNALTEPFSLVLTESVAKKYFGNENPIGEVITDSKKRNYTITAVIEDVPENSHFKFNILSSFSSLDLIDGYKNSINGWGFQYTNVYTYIKVKKNYDINILENEFSKIVETYLSGNPMFKFSLTLQPIEKIHLYFGNENNLRRIYLFGVIGILILLIPCINYMNLNTAESIKRLKEVGVRKVVGAYHKQLIKQFLTESIIISLFSLMLAITLAEILLPVFNNILSIKLAFNYSTHWILSLSFILIAIFVGVIAGSYPAFYLSSFKTTDALQGKFVFGSRKAFFRNTFVVLQFAISIFLICVTGVIFMQLRYSNKADIGIEKDNIVAVDLFESNIKDPYLVKDQLLQIPEISKVSISEGVPFIHTAFNRINFDETNADIPCEIYNSDTDFMDLFNMQIVKGQRFLKNYSTKINDVIVNETLVKKINWENPIGKKFSPIENDSIEYTVIGVVKDFHRSSFHNIIQPAFIIPYINTFHQFKSAIIKVNSSDLSKTINKIESVLKNLNTEWDFSLQFLDQKIKNEYQEEYKTGLMFMIFAILAIFITSIGLYGLALFIARQRTKEIGIRKIFGSSIANIIKLLIKQFIKIITVALLIALPAAWYYSDKWLQSFAYKFDNRWIVFVFATVIVLIISFITIIYQSSKAAISNPINAIKYE